jgi:hypothetical protein
MRQLAVVALVAAAFSSSALAQNQLVNPSFGSGLSGWTPTGAATASFNSDDASGSAFSGSAMIGAGSGGAVGGLTQCVPAHVSVPFNLVFRTRLASGSSGDAGSGGVAFASYAFFSDAHCATPLPGADTSVTTTPTSSWSAASVVAVGRPAAPAGVGSALVTIGVQNHALGPFPIYEFDDVLFAPYRPITVTVPASASIHGQNNAFFQTDLWLVNESPVVSVPVTARHFCFAGQTCGGGVKTANVPPRGTAQYADAVGSFFGDPGTAGALEITYDSALSRVTILTRTYSPSLPAPTTGSGLVALEDFEARTLSVISGLASNGGDLSSGFRSNVGAYNPDGESSGNVTFTLFDAQGAQIGQPVVKPIGPKEPVQVNDIFAAAGASQTVTTNAYVVVSSNLDIFSYATVIDNRSTDSVIATGQPDQTTIYP